MKAMELKVRLVALMAVLCFVFFGAQAAVAQQTFSFPNFSSNTTTLQLNGSAMVVTPDVGPAFLQLTPALGGKVGSTFYKTLLPLQAGFTSTFTFQFTGRGGPNAGGADGIAFVIQNASGGSMTLGNGGGAIGYGDNDGDDPKDGIRNSLAVEFDTYANGWDPSNNHVAIQTCGDANNNQHHNGVCGAGHRNALSPTLGIVNLTPGTINLIDGNPHTAIITYAPPCDGCQNLTVNLDGHLVLAVSFDIASLGLDANDDAYVGFTGSTGGDFENNDVLSWSFSSQTITQPVSSTAPTTFAFSNTVNTVLSHTVDFTPPTNAHNLTYPLNDPGTLQIQSTNTAVDANTWPQYVHGGPLAPSLLFPLADDNPGGTGSNGGLFVDVCFDPTLSGNALIPLDANCPTVPVGADPSTFLAINIIADIVPPKPPIPAGTTTVLAHYEPNTTGTTTWSPSTINATANPACVTTTGLSTGTQPAPPTKCDVLDIEQVIKGDQTTSSGKARTQGAFAFVYNVPMLLSTVSVNGTQVNAPPINNNAAAGALWFRTPLNLSFLVNPACSDPTGVTCPSTPSGGPGGNNFFSPAPVAGENFDVPGFVSSTPATPQAGFDTSAVRPVTFTAQPSLGDGQYTLEWSAFDNVGILEQNQQQVPQLVPGFCPDGSPVAAGGACYTTNLFSAPLNVDSTPPAITITSPTATTYTANQHVAAAYGCADNPGSGVATCAGPVASGSNIDTTATAGHLTPKTFTVNATDKALPLPGNASSKAVDYTVTCDYAAVKLSPSPVTRPAFINVTTSVMDCMLTPQTVKVKFTLSGPLGKNCGISSADMFTTPSFTIKSGTSSSFSFPFLITKGVCAGTYNITTATIQGVNTIDSVSSTLIVH
jgi:hypothetical protein